MSLQLRNEGVIGISTLGDGWFLSTMSCLLPSTSEVRVVDVMCLKCVVKRYFNVPSKNCISFKFLQVW